MMAELTLVKSDMEKIKFSDLIRSYGNKTLFLGEEARLSYNEVSALGCKAEFQLTRRRLVFCLAENDLGSLAGYIGLLVADAVPLMLSAGIEHSQLQELIAAYRPAYIWLSDSRRDDFRGLDCVISFEGYCLLDFGAKACQINNSLSLLLSTSGSTGTPKFVRLSHENVISNALSIAQYMELSSDEIPITTLPPSYTYGLSIIHSHLLVGATIAITNKTLFDRTFWDFFRQVKATNFGGVPYHYEILKKLRFTKMDLPSLNMLSQAGGRMEAELTKEFAEFGASRGIRFFTMYGQVEATARMSYLPSTKAISKAGSIGNAIPGGNFWIEDDLRHPIEGADVVGQLMYRGSNVFMGYAHEYIDLAKGDEYQGILPTGDLAKRDAEGDYYIVGRLKRFIKLFGHRVNLLDVEEFLLNKGYLVACTGQDNLLEVYCPKLAVDNARLIKRFIVEHLKLAPKSVIIYAVDDLPRNESGKIQYAELIPKIGVLLV
jgi:acyl-coenzyme A synthetase/AMP-(fatty) acid ligase